MVGLWRRGRLETTRSCTVGLSGYLTLGCTIQSTAPRSCGLLGRRASCSSPNILGCHGEDHSFGPNNRRERKGGMQGFCGFAYDYLSVTQLWELHSTRAEVVLAPVLSKPTLIPFHRGGPSTHKPWLTGLAGEP